MVLLPVPRMPAMCHVSSIVSSVIGISDRPALTICPSALFMLIPHAAHWACMQPEAHGQRPLTRHPPSTAVVLPIGLSEPAIQASGFVPHTSRWARSGKSDASHAQTLIRLATHAVEPQPRPTSATTSRYVRTLVSYPPKRFGSNRRQRPD